MYINGQWSTLTPKQMPDAADPVAELDVSILQNDVLAPILNIEDPRESNDIDFIGGIKGTDELEMWVDDGRAVLAFSMYPTSMEQLFAVADGRVLIFLRRIQHIRARGVVVRQRLRIQIRQVRFPGDGFHGLDVLPVQPAAFVVVPVHIGR